MFGNSVQILVFEDRDFGGGGGGRRWRSGWGKRGGAGGSGRGCQEKLFCRTGRAFQLLLLVLFLPLG